MRASGLKALAIATVLAGCALTTTAPAQAAGCGGYVNVFVSGCAPWDNNARRMPGAPGYQARRPTAQPAPRITTPTVQSRIQPAPVAQRPIVSPTTQNRLIGNDGSTLISPGNRTGIVAGGAGNLISPGNRNPGLIANDGASMRR